VICVNGLQVLTFFIGLSSWAVRWLVLGVWRAGPLWAELALVLRQVLLGGAIGGYLMRFFRKEIQAGFIDVWGTGVEWIDWRVFFTQSFYMLLGGYCCVIDSQMGRVVAAQLSIGLETAADAEADELLWTVLGYSFVPQVSVAQRRGTPDQQSN
jgi:hypothetical protein